MSAAVVTRNHEETADADRDLIRYINLKLSALGLPVSTATAEQAFLSLAEPLLRTHRQQERQTGYPLCPVDARIQAFLDRYLGTEGDEAAPRLPTTTFVLDRPGLARVLSLPATADAFSSEHVDSYKVPQGVLHNPRNDRRTTKGVFHVVEGGSRVPSDKIEVPKHVFRALLTRALTPPHTILTLPFTSDQPDQARAFVSLLQRPIVCPATPAEPEKSMEIRFFAPGSLISNLDFVERIFGNAGDPYLPENDAALDCDHWTGHTGCVILAPNLTHCTKQELGLPHFDQATARQRRDGMCWREPGEFYNGGQAFKVACRDRSGFMVTVIADNYFGYCKKEVKTQISFAANLYGLAEEEHAGGAIGFASYLIGQDLHGNRTVHVNDTTYPEAVQLLGDRAIQHADGYACDRLFPEVVYVPENAQFSVREGYITWDRPQADPARIRLRADKTYVMPSGYRVQLQRQPGSARWRLVGTRPEATFCHKPCTVSGGGKSEISKSIAYAILKGPVFVRDYPEDMDQLEKILKMDFSDVYKTPQPGNRASRPILSPERSLGSAIKLLTPSPDYKDAYNEWLQRLAPGIRQLVCVVKRYYRPEWGDNLRAHFTVDQINGHLGNELKLDDELLVGNYLRVGFETDGSWRVYKLRPDFHPAQKVQAEDDITASVVVPSNVLPCLDPEYANPSVKLVFNCESLLFQRPDEAVHRGFDKQAEADICGDEVFLSNFEPLDIAQVQDIADHVVEFDKYTEPVKRLVREFLETAEGHLVLPSNARIVNGKPSKNPRYLQRRPDITTPVETYVAEVGARLHRKVPASEKLYFPVNAVLAGRLGSRADAAAGLPPLAVYSPIHYQELPELFMDFICSLTGKSPSTTGFGSEGALTKRPFNALVPVIDVNNALVTAILTGYAGFTTAASYIGPQYRVDHDISMLAPEIWCRMRVEERDPAFLIANGYLEKLTDFDYQGRQVPASRLGYRITKLFAEHFLGRIFETPDVVIPEAMLRPEKQNLAAFVDGIEAIVAAQARVAQEYFEDRSVDLACPPLRALLHLMAFGQFEGATVDDPRIRALFTREALLSSDWYRERLATKQRIDIALWQHHVAALEQAGETFGDRLQRARQRLAVVSSPEYLQSLVGTIGADPAAHEGTVPTPAS